jgi:hypothetical protein
VLAAGLGLLAAASAAGALVAWRMRPRAAAAA